MFFCKIADNRQLADMMNFVVFGLGGASAPKGAKPFTAAEVGRLRTRALATESLIAARAEIVGKMVDRCAVPKSRSDRSRVRFSGRLSAGFEKTAR